MTPRPLFRLPLATLFVVSACHAPEEARIEAPRPVAAPATPAPPPRPPVVVSHARSAPPASDPVLVISDPQVLGRLAARGFDAGTAIVGERAETTSDLAKHPSYRTLVDAITRDLEGDRRRDRAAGVGMRHAHRQFDATWLASPNTRFELIAVVNRMDRRPFAPNHCGEVRAVYRLAYHVDTKTGPVDSRLPMTVNVVSFVEPDAAGLCASAARAWYRPVPEPLDEAAWLVSDDGPLSAARRATWRPKSVETNLQSVRWPSTVRPAMGGHAEYVLRVFRRLEDAPFFEPSTLENTLDADRLRESPALRDELVEWIRSPEVLRAIDAGTAVVPEEFLATRAVSVAPHGLARLGNRPFKSALDPGVFAGLDLRGTETVRSPKALLRRLDALSCPGCHQSRSLAGFHLLGVEPGGDVVDAVEVPMSAHFHADLGRRGRYLAALAGGATPDDARPPAERGEGDDGAGAHCGLGDAGFAAWTCAAGLHCTRVDDEDVGECVSDAGPQIGDACETGVVSQAADPHGDVVRLGAPLSCGQGRVCEANSVGFPGGMCSGGCESLPPGAACGGIPLLTEFNGCLASGTSFAQCIANHSRPGALRACSFHAPCRDDYVCARAAQGGVCMPPYFLFQLRVDGHPI